MTGRELERVAREQRRRLLAYARRGANSHHDAEDAVQDALTITVAICERIRRETAIAYIGTTAHHAALHLTRQAARAVSLGEPTTPAASRHDLIADARPTDPDSRLDMLAGLRALKRDEARALAARMLGYSYREIADGFGWSYTKTNRCISEGRARLRALLAADTADPPSPNERAAA
jgi:DNA-directed RNA polymerase specialized sigma24 family protein